MNLHFTNPWLLAGLLAVGLPVLVHFLTRARPRRVKFPPYQFLLEACAGQQALHRLRQWIILALRTLAIVALVALFARPFLRAAGINEKTEASRRVVFIVDASLSMRAAQGGVSLFSRSQGEAADLLRGLEPGSLAGVILAGSQARPVLPSLSRNLAALHDELVRAHPTLEFADAGAAVALAKRMLGGGGTVYVFSDFQQSNWSGVNFGVDDGVRWLLRPVTREAVPNIAVTAAQVTPAEPVAGESIELTCALFNSSPQPRQETVRLELTSVTQEKGVTLQPYAMGEVTFQFTMTSPGQWPGKITIGNDDLLDDNTRYVTVRVQPARRLLVLSDSEPTDRRAAANFVAKALAPSEAAAPGLTVIRRHSQDTDRGTLENADAFVLVAPATIPPEVAAVIQRRVTDGAQLICLLDGPSAPHMAGALGIAPPFQLLRPVTTAGEAFAAADLSRGPLKVFAEAGQADLATLRFRRHYQTQPVAGHENEVLLTFADGSAALSLSSAGRGTAVFGNFALTTDAANLFGSPLFPAMLHELLRAMRRSDGAATVTPGQPWQLEAVLGEGDFQVVNPTGEKVPATVVSRGRNVRLALPAATVVGHFQVKQNGMVTAVGAVNVDPRESDTRLMPLTELVRGNVKLVTSEGELLGTAQERPLWPALAGVAVGAFGLEMLLLALWRKLPQRVEVKP